jgi:hypothetical protein
MKLSAAQLLRISRGGGIFNEDEWRGCIAYLFALRTSNDPSDSDAWNACMASVRMVLSWALSQCALKYGRAAHECLVHASTHCMMEELNHIVIGKTGARRARCVFSHRARLPYYKAPLRARQTVSRRVQRRFYSWKHHAQTGLQSPHFTPSYVYESHFSHLINAVYTLGRMPEMLQGVASSPELALPADECVWTTHPMWSRVCTNINALMRCIWLYLSPETRVL